MDDAWNEYERTKGALAAFDIKHTAKMRTLIALGKALEKAGWSGVQLQNPDARSDKNPQIQAGDEPIDPADLGAPTVEQIVRERHTLEEAHSAAFHALPKSMRDQLRTRHP